MPGACSPTWLAATTNAWPSIARARSRTSQWSRVVANVNAAGTVITLRALDREDPVQLGEADVVTDGQPELDAVGGLGDARSRRPAPRARTPCRRGRRPRRRTCGSCGSSAFSSPSGPTWSDVLRAALVAGLRARRTSRRRGRCRARGRCASPTAGSGRRTARRRRSVCSGVPSTGHFSGSTTSSAPACGRVAGQAVGGREVAVAVGVDCSWTAAARMRVLLPHGLTRQSIRSRAYRSAPHGASASRWRWVGAFGPGRDAVRRARAGRRDARARGGRCGTARGCARARAA